MTKLQLVPRSGRCALDLDCPLIMAANRNAGEVHYDSEVAYKYSRRYCSSYYVLRIIGYLNTVYRSES